MVQLGFSFGGDVRADVSLHAETAASIPKMAGETNLVVWDARRSKKAILSRASEVFRSALLYRGLLQLILIASAAELAGLEVWVSTLVVRPSHARKRTPARADAVPPRKRGRPKNLNRREFVTRCRWHHGCEKAPAAGQAYCSRAHAPNADYGSGKEQGERRDLVPRIKMTDRRRQLMLRVADGDARLLPVLYHFDSHRRCDDILSWLVQSRKTGAGLWEWMRFHHEGSPMKVQAFVISKLEKSPMRPLYMGRDVLLNPGPA